jgi:hypothetical protein
MPSSLNAGFTNNINILAVRANSTVTQKLTDRSVDLDGDGNKEAITITHVSGHAEGTASAPGGRIVQTVVTPAGFKNTVMESVVETDGGVHTDEDVSQFTEGLD